MKKRPADSGRKDPASGERENSLDLYRKKETLLKVITDNIPSTYLSIIEKDMTIGFTAGGEFTRQGLDPESFVGMTLEEVFREQAPFVRERYEKAFLGEEVFFELEINDQQQEYRVIPLPGEGGEVERILVFVENVTERNKAAAKLWESEEKFRTAFRTSPESIIISRAEDGKIIDVNEGFERTTGYTREEAIGRPTRDLELWVDLSERDRLVSAVSERGMVQNLETRFRVKGGRVIHCLVSASLIHLGGEAHYLSVVRDITPRIEALEAARRHQNLVERITETSPVGITVVDREGRVTFANRRAQEILGLEEDQITRRSYNAPEWRITGLDGGPFPDGDLPFVRVAGTLEPVFDVRHSIQWPDGRMVKLSVNAVPMLDENGRFDGMVASIEDITDRMAREDDLLESEERFRRIVQSSPMGIHMYRLEERGRLVFTGGNPAADRILGVDHGLFVGRTLEEAFPGLVGTELPAAYVKVALDGSPWHGEQVYYEDGVISGAFDVHAFRTGPGTIAVKFLEISDRLRAEEQVKASLSLKETLLREIHHRVKNNLHVISGLLELQTRHIDDERYRNIFKESQNRILAMALIHEELYGAEDLASVDFGGFVRNLVRILVNSYALDRKEIAVQHDLDEVTMVIDTAIPCGLIINELVSNSLKHGFPGGRGGTIRISFRAVGEKEYELVVADDGVGLPRDLDISRTPSLGLKLVTALADQLKSRLHISRENGTSFSFRFREYREADSVL